jgi:hypothetical protein
MTSTLGDATIDTMLSVTPRTGYAPVNGRKMDYEVHGPDHRRGHAPGGVPPGLLLAHPAYVYSKGGR